MAKGKKRTLPARKASRNDDSLLIRSAESLGRVIGSLQRQVRGVVPTVGNRTSILRPSARTASDRPTTKRKSTAAQKAGRSTKRARTHAASKKR
jgi:hypothetical protein